MTKKRRPLISKLSALFIALTLILAGLVEPFATDLLPRTLERPFASTAIAEGDTSPTPDEEVIPIAPGADDQFTLTVGQALRFALEHAAQGESPKWQSSDEEIATVSPSGQVKAIAPGTAEIHVGTSEGDAEAVIYITVEAVNKAEKLEEMVWIPRTGKKYHSNPRCSGMKNPTEVPIRTAEKTYGRCKNCW